MKPFDEKKIARLLDHVRKHSKYVEHNKKLIEIVEGELLPKVKKALREQMSEQAYKAAEPRIPPINVLQQMNDKLSTIYENGVQRQVVKTDDSEGSDSDAATLSYLHESMDPDTYFGEANKFFNLNKGVLLQPYISEVSKDEVRPAMRVITYDKFLPYCEDRNEPEKPTGFILYMGSEVRKVKGKPEGKVDIYLAIEAEQFCWFTSDEENITHEKDPSNPDGISDLGRIPLVYINKSKTRLIPLQDTDTLAMSILLAVLLTDVNFGAAFQAFGIIYTVNVNPGQLQFGPGAVWHFNQKPDDERKPEVGTLKADCDIDAMLNSIANQYALWLQTKGIKPGQVGEINASNFTSGISKMLDEMDTSSNRKKQVPFFQKAESEFWDIVLKTLLPVWRQQYGSRLKFGGTFDPTSKIATAFPEQVPLQRRGAVVDETKKEQDAGYLDYRGALKRLHPTYTDRQIDDLIRKIEEDKTNAGRTTTDNSGETEGGEGQGTRPTDRKDDDGQSAGVDDDQSSTDSTSAG